MAASRSDQAVLAGDATFISRVRSALEIAAIAINNEARTVPNGFPAWAVSAYYDKRAKLAQQIGSLPDTFAPLFAKAVATDANVIADATVAGVIPLTGANVAAQAALVTDAHIDTAVSGQFNTFVPFNG